jgi:regulator of replication initiation timing
LTRQLQSALEEKKAIQHANDELNARLESSGIEETLKKASDEIEDLKRRVISLPLLLCMSFILS